MYDNLENIKVFQEKEKGNYISFSNNDGKSWTIPIKHMHTGMEIYEPSGIKGKLVKKALPVLSPFGGYRLIPGCSRSSVEFAEPLGTLLDSIYPQYELAVFWGTPCIDQKVTMQVFRGNQIFGYCKIGNSQRVRTLFQHEERILKELELCGVKNVPQCKGVFPLNAEEMAFVQTTQKRVGASVEHQFGTKHQDFLQMMFEKTKKHILFEESDFYESLVYLKNNIAKLKPEYQEAVASVTNVVLDRFRNQQVLWGVCHRDFTPWNTCISGVNLFVFDFEYALRYAPKEIDVWHFYTQTALYERKMTSEEIAREFVQEHKDRLAEYRLYLLDSISLYLLRGEPADIEIANGKAQILDVLKRVYNDRWKVGGE